MPNVFRYTVCDISKFKTKNRENRGVAQYSVNFPNLSKVILEIGASYFSFPTQILNLSSALWTFNAIMLGAAF